MDEIVEQPAKRKPGRPKKVIAEPLKAKPVEAAAPPKVHKLRAKPNWEDMAEYSEETPDRLRIDPSMIPEGYSLQWVTDSVFGKEVNRRGMFEKRGWTPVHQEDFDGVFNGMFMPKGAEGEIQVEGLVLMTRPIQLTQRAQQADKRAAMNQVLIKEQSLRYGEIQVTAGMDARHPTAVGSNKINKTVERINIPD